MLTTVAPKESFEDPNTFVIYSSNNNETENINNKNKKYREIKVSDIQGRIKAALALEPGEVPFSPVVSGTGLSKNEVIRPNDLAVRTRSDAVHGPRLEIHKNSPGNIPPSAGFIVVHINPLDLGLSFTMVLSGSVDAVLGADDFPELSADLVSP
ncbi:hypothetical protein Ddye_022353 [Dipteronia dyeriana]|uniref:Uncharacterized protein n=1 Tax=Dipteronia dyeriana TaxID=168575 RepID=A0AAD9U406_9ROSI|nr:hypothetical protein Ddye_022353 [Dipteronia dyeriana]